jgi:RNA polymerase sigma-70 factor (ECF subfamily)
MNDAGLVEQARAGDPEAFTTLVQRYQHIAFGYAWSITSQADLAEEAAQRAFIVAWRSLTSLRNPERFGAWLRGIVRFECLHLLRSQPRSHVALEGAGVLVDPTASPHEIAERNEATATLLAALASLPEAERIVATTYYVHGRSQREVADFLNLPVTTVNNRLRTARQHLRHQGDLRMTLSNATPFPNDFADRVATIIRAEGAVIDARPDPGQRPSVMSQVRLADAGSIAQVAQYLDDDTIRCVMLAPDSTPPAGTTLHQVTDPSPLPLSIDAVRDVVARITPASHGHQPIETGIKVVDACCPLQSGSLVALLGDMHSGKMVLVEELVHRLTDPDLPITIVVFAEATTEVAALRALDYRASATVEAVYLPVADASAVALAPVLGAFDTVISLSRELGSRRLYPAIDPLRSHSRGDADDPVVADLRRALEAGSDRETIAQLEHYLTQPFYVAEPYTHRPGVSVPRETTLANLRALLDGIGGEIAPEVLYMTGALEPTST